jgi:hypothetical protein
MGKGKLEGRSREPPVRTLFGCNVSVSKSVKAASVAYKAAPLQGAGFLLPTVSSAPFELSCELVLGVLDHAAQAFGPDRLSAETGHGLLFEEVGSGHRDREGFGVFRDQPFHYFVCRAPGIGIEDLDPAGFIDLVNHRPLSVEDDHYVCACRVLIFGQRFDQIIASRSRFPLMQGQ